MVAQIDQTYLRYNPSVLWPRLLAYAVFEGRPLTTRGQWLNPAILAGYQIWTRWPGHKPAKAPIMLYGQGRSGTTLLGRVLGLHPQLAFLNEPKALWHAAVGDDDLIGSYSQRPGRYTKTAYDATPRRAARARKAYRAIAALTRRPRILDKYPEQIFRDEMVRTIFPDARRIILLRDPYQTAASVSQWSARHATGAADWWGQDGRKWHLLCHQVLRHDAGLRSVHARLGNFTRQEDRAALEWLACARRAIMLAREAPDNLRIVRFEELCAAPVMTIRQLMKFSGLAQDDRVLTFARDHISGPKPYPTPQIDPAVCELIEQVRPVLDRFSANPHNPVEDVA